MISHKWIEIIFAVIFIFFIVMFLPRKSSGSLIWHYPYGYASFVYVVVALNMVAIVFINILSGPLVLVPVVIIYTFVPAILAWISESKLTPSRFNWLDLIVILSIWLPIEFYGAIGRVSGIKGSDFSDNAIHILAYGLASVMALVIFKALRQSPGLKFNLPKSKKDFFNFLTGFIVSAVILIPVSLYASFIGPFNFSSEFSLLGFCIKFCLILVSVALPEELLFRSLIQSWLTARWGNSNKVIFLAALIFGASHLNNKGFPNLKYFAIATVAGFIYGKVFQKSSSIFASAGLHAMVNAVRHTFFI